MCEQKESEIAAAESALAVADAELAVAEAAMRDVSMHHDPRCRQRRFRPPFRRRFASQLGPLDVAQAALALHMDCGKSHRIQKRPAKQDRLSVRCIMLALDCA